MTIVNFTPLESFSGGILIGIATVLFLLTTGRIAGISGIAKGMFSANSKNEFLLRLVFVLGLIIGGFLYNQSGTNVQNASVLSQLDLKLVLGAIFVGVGTSYGNGCTSGHGICGLARKSKRSLVATLTFMFFGFLTVFILGA